MKKKILLIVGAITAFVLSAVGIIHYNMPKVQNAYGVPPIDPIVDMLKMNGRIEQYSGKINGNDLKLLIRVINAYNANQMYPTDLIINDSSNARITLVNSRQYSGDNIVDSNLYEISLEYGEDGFITEINVSDIKGEN